MPMSLLRDQDPGKSCGQIAIQYAVLAFTISNNATICYKDLCILTNYSQGVPLRVEV